MQPIEEEEEDFYSFEEESSNDDKKEGDTFINGIDQFISELEAFLDDKPRMARIERLNAALIAQQQEKEQQQQAKLPPPPPKQSFQEWKNAADLEVPEWQRKGFQSRNDWLSYHLTPKGQRSKDAYGVSLMYTTCVNEDGQKIANVENCDKKSLFVDMETIKDTSTILYHSTKLMLEDTYQTLPTRQQVEENARAKFNTTVETLALQKQNVFQTVQLWSNSTIEFMNNMKPNQQPFVEESHEFISDESDEDDDKKEKKQD
jgi:hypothetical protein